MTSTLQELPGDVLSRIEVCLVMVEHILYREVVYVQDMR